jgi:hypothetical protein
MREVRINDITRPGEYQVSYRRMLRDLKWVKPADGGDAVRCEVFNPTEWTTIRYCYLDSSEYRLIHNPGLWETLGIYWRRVKAWLRAENWRTND